MNNLMIFTLGTFIFVTYMFFLGRMIWKQHQIQKEKRPNMFVLKDELENNDKRKAS